MHTNLCQYQTDYPDKSKSLTPIPEEYVVCAEWFDEDGYPRYTEVHIYPGNPVWTKHAFENIKGANITLWGAEPMRNT